MPSEPRFLNAVDNTRPYGSHRYEVYGPKIGRISTLFGQAALRAWTLLESDPQIACYCERPIVIAHAKPRRVVDFWARRGDKDELWILLRDSEISNGEENSFQLSSFRQWAASNKFEVKLIDPGDFHSRHNYFENWGVILRYLSQNEKLVSAELTAQVYELTEAPTTLAALQSKLLDYDPVIVRTALFSLIHQGKLQCLEIHAKPIDAHSRFAAI